MSQMRARFKREIGELDDIVELVAHFFESEDLDSEHRNPVDLAIEEVFTNMIRHNPSGRGEILITIDRGDGELVLSMTDYDSDEFDLATAPRVDTDLPLEQRRPGGLGIHLIHEMMDSVDYEYRDRESKVTMTRRIV